MGTNIPPPREPPIEGQTFWFTRPWWRFFNQIETASDGAIGIANNALSVANAADLAAATAQTAAVAAQATATTAQLEASSALDIGTEALLKPDPVIPDLNQAVFLSLMLGA
jgi:hypothetical protein